MIVVNWGTSNFRAYKLDGEGNVEAEKSSGRGAVSVPPGGFEDALRTEIGDWIGKGNGRVLMCGMVGARRGWKEAPYVPVPAAFEQVAEGVIRLEVEGLDARIVAGLSGTDENGVPEVLRGEETEIFGCEGDLEKYIHLCLPGTHTKWVRMEGGQIRAFTTAMTGDLFKAVRENTILRSCTQHEPDDAEAFLLGVARAKQPGELANHLFGVRTLILAGKLKETSASSFLSGLLIGHEVRAAAREGESVHLVGDAALCLLYQKAMHAFGVDSSIEAEGAALRGLKRIAGRLHW